MYIDIHSRFIGAIGSTALPSAPETLSFLRGRGERLTHIGLSPSNRYASLLSNWEFRVSTGNYR